jgi:hypothetical protein
VDSLETREAVRLLYDSTQLDAVASRNDRSIRQENVNAGCAILEDRKIRDRNRKATFARGDPPPDRQRIAHSIRNVIAVGVESSLRDGRGRRQARTVVDRAGHRRE